ncbi:hypothetical protein PHISP_07998, partial [Aspergillus sp. HF37]
APRTCQNFLQHCQDGYYAGTIFHRVSPDFVVQGGDPSGTGSGGTSIFEYPEFEYDPDARDPNEKVVLRDELHSRLRFTRRGLVGMAKSEDGSYGSQFFITLANTERELNGQCTLFGRIEGDSIFNVLKIAEAERMEGSERPVYPVKVTSCEVGELGPLAGKLKKRQLTAAAAAPEKPAPKKKKKAKGGKALLSFGADEGEEDMPVRPAKPKFNPNLVTEGSVPDEPAQKAAQPQQLKEPEPQPRKRPRSLSPERSPSVERKHRPKSPDPLTQLPLPRPESPARSPDASPPARPSILSRTNAEIESVKASMRRDTAAGPADSDRPKSALEAMIPESAIRGRRRPPLGNVNGAGRGSATNGVTGFSSSADHDALRVFNAFKSKLENADSHQSQRKHAGQNRSQKPEEADEEAEEPQLGRRAKTSRRRSRLDGHELRFGKDLLGKDLSWKKERPGDADSLMVIDPREKEKEIAGAQQGRKKGFVRDRERDRKRERAGDLEWERAR